MPIGDHCLALRVAKQFSRRQLVHHDLIRAWLGYQIVQWQIEPEAESAELRRFPSPTNQFY